MALVSLDDIKSYLQITVTTYDSLLTMYEELVTGEVEAYVGRPLMEAYYTDEPLQYQFSRNEVAYNRSLGAREPRPQLFMLNYPITAETIFVEGSTFDADKYNLNRDNGVVTMYEQPSDDKFRVTANYTAGYTTATTPADLKYVVLEGVKKAYINGGSAKQGSGNISSKKVKDFSVSYGGNTDTSEYVSSGEGEFGKAYLLGNTSTLDRYKRVRI